MKKVYRSRFLQLFVLLSFFALTASKAPTGQEKFIWMAKKYNTDKVYVISEAIPLADGIKVKEVKLRFKSAAFRQFGKDSKGDIEIENSSPKSSQEAIEKARQKQIEKMKKKGWKVLELNRFTVSKR